MYFIDCKRLYSAPISPSFHIVSPLVMDAQLQFVIMLLDCPFLERYPLLISLVKDLHKYVCFSIARVHSHPIMHCEISHCHVGDEEMKTSMSTPMRHQATVDSQKIA